MSWQQILNEVRIFDSGRFNVYDKSCATEWSRPMYHQLSQFCQIPPWISRCKKCMLHQAVVSFLVILVLSLMPLMPFLIWIFRSVLLLIVCICSCVCLNEASQCITVFRTGICSNLYTLNVQRAIRTQNVMLEHQWTHKEIYTTKPGIRLWLAIIWIHPGIRLF